jgi:hypothetical protein
MLKGKPGAFAMALIGVSALYYPLGALAKGSVNFGGGRGRDYFITWADSPKLFAFGIIFLTILGSGCCVLAWKFWRGDEDT